MNLRLKSKKIHFGVDLGTTGLKWVALERRKRGIHLLRYGLVPLAPEAMVAKEIMDRQLVMDALMKATEDWVYPPYKLTANVSGKGVILKRTKIPVQKEQDLMEAITWQVRENVPFDISEVTWDGLLLGEAKGKGADVIIAAVKNEVAYSILDLFRSADLSVDSLSTDAISLWNLLSAAGKGKEEISSVLQIGYETTGVLSLRGGTFEGYREIPIAAKIYEEALMRFLDLPQDEARGIISGKLPEGVALEDILKITKSVHGKFSEQLERAAPLFSSSKKEKPGKIYLSGGGAFLPGLKEYFEETKSIEVEVLNIFELFGKPEIAEEEGLLGPILNVATGLALQEARPAARINLLPFDERPKEKKPLGIGSVGVVLVPVLIALLGIYINQRTKIQEIEKLERRVKRVEQEDARLRRQVSEIAELESKESDIKARIEVIRQLERGRFGVIKLLDEVNRTIPEGVWLTALEKDKKNQSHSWLIEGAALSVQDIVKFMANLRNSRYLTDPQLVVTARKKMGEKEAVTFQLKVNLNDKG